MSADSLDQPNLTVHHFVHGSSSTFSTSRSLILGQSRRLVAQVIDNAERWQLTYRPAPSKARDWSTVCFTYAPRPPYIEGTRLINLKEWGTPVDRDEVFRIQDLQEFSSTNFTAVYNKAVTPTRPAPLLDGLPLTKRKRDDDPLYDLIPQPHFLSSPDCPSERKIKLPPYKKSRPVMIPPYDSPLTEPFGEWDRCAWLVPIRGSLPWSESTSGMLLDSSYDTPISPTTQTNEIIWTHKAVSKFWAFLLEIRTAGNLGPIGLSFHPASPPYGSEKSVRISKTLATERHTGLSRSSTSGSAPLVTTMDYIKIYHDWAKTLYLRRILDAWSFEIGESKIRVLLGAKLVLLDDRSRGVMVL
ncbi:hypothetical protein P691DRAFT_725331 [Macrolepiota fuliginosa MF-IS2]|uniref:Uncharacterized protein n=1 Tax=Macrolepiota fuliginosa MF-IS2 TaxID=1400762 RepID=A0A9P5XI72_9AGAR|nr:hypothetical protein P691DRAFT_725331 [Macrolepiota fuliginosa MF-IS2]